jgi:hypothetical protein
VKFGEVDLITYDDLKTYVDKNMYGAKVEINPEGEIVIRTSLMVGVDGERLTRHIHSLYYEWHSNT